MSQCITNDRNHRFCDILATVALQRRVLLLFAIALCLVATGMAGMVFLEGRTWMEALYFTIVTLATVGYGDITPHTTAGRFLVIGLIVAGIGVIGYGFTTITTFIVEGELSQILRRRKMVQAIEKLHDHYIVCGFGETGRFIAEELAKTGHRFVVVDQDEETVTRLAGHDHLYIIGDATADENLLQAGVQRATGLVTTLSDDKDNLFVVLTARELNPGLRIISKGVGHEIGHKLKKAGADSVVQSNLIGAMRMASEMIRPTVVGFLDLMLREKDRAIRIEEVSISESSHLAHKPIGNSRVPDAQGALVMAIRRGEGEYDFTPNPDAMVNPGDTLIIFGTLDEIARARTAAA